MPRMKAATDFGSTATNALDRRFDAISGILLSGFFWPGVDWLGVQGGLGAAIEIVAIEIVAIEPA